MELLHLLFHFFLLRVASFSNPRQPKETSGYQGNKLTSSGVLCSQVTGRVGGSLTACDGDCEWQDGICSPKITEAGGKVTVWHGNWCCDSGSIRWRSQDRATPGCFGCQFFDGEREIINFIAPQAGIFQVDIANVKGSGHGSGSYGRIFLVADGLKQLEKGNSTFKILLKLGDTIGLRVEDQSDSGYASDLQMAISWGNRMNNQTEVFDYNDLIDGTRVPTFAAPEDNCRGGYCGKNAFCTSSETCECFEGYSGVPYFWGGCNPDPCRSGPCGAFAICEPSSGIQFKCTCPEGPNYIRDPKDPLACVLNPCSNEAVSGSRCKPNLERDVCECINDPSVPSPTDLDPEDGFYGEWGEWSACPLTCRASDNDLPMRRTRRRSCNLPRSDEGLACSAQGPAIEEQMCNERLCPRPPSWSAWGPWESCSSACLEDGEGTQLRRRVCLETGTMEDTCSSQPPPGPLVQITKCQAVKSCAETILGEWSSWSSCDLTCHTGDEMGSQTRSRSCSSRFQSKPSNFSGSGLDPSSGQACFDIPPAYRQFRVCPEVLSCPVSPCHADWWKQNPGGKFFYGCADPENNGIYWCPPPGGVDNQGVVKKGGSKHICSKDETYADVVSVIRIRRSSPQTEGLNVNVEERSVNENESCENSFQKLLEDCDGKDDGELCSAVNSIYAEGNNNAVSRTEEIGIVKNLTKLVGWDPLTKNDEGYISAFVKFEFFQDALNLLPEYMKECTVESPTFKATCVERECTRIRKGNANYIEEIKDSVSKLQEVSKSLNETYKNFAIANIAIEATSTTIGAALTVVGIIGIFAAPFTGGASLVLTGAAVAAGAASLVSSLVEAGITNKKLGQLKKKHHEAGRCVKRITVITNALEESTSQVRDFIGTKDWTQTMDKLGNIDEIKMEENINLIVSRYLEAYTAVNASIGDSNMKKLLNDIEFNSTGKAEVDTETKVKSGITITKGILERLTACLGVNRTSEAKPSIENNTCILNLAPVTLLLKGCKLTLNPDESKVCSFAVHKAVDTYTLGKNIRQNIAKVRKHLIEYRKRFLATSSTSSSSTSSSSSSSPVKKDLKKTKRFKFLTKLDNTFSKIVGGPTFTVDGKKHRLFDVPSDLKKQAKTGLRKRLRKALTKLGHTAGSLKGPGTHVGKLLEKGTKLLDKKGGKVASKVFFGALDVGLGIWGIISNVEKLQNGSAEATLFYEASLRLSVVMNITSSFIRDQYNDCQKNSLNSACTWSSWSTWSSCQPSNGSDLAYDEDKHKNNGWIQMRTRKVDGLILEANLCPGEPSQIKPCLTDDVIKGPGWIKVTVYSGPLQAAGYYRRSKMCEEAGKPVYEKIGSTQLKIYFEDGNWTIGAEGQTIIPSYNETKFEFESLCGDKSLDCPLGKWKIGRENTDLFKISITCATFGCSGSCPINCALNPWSVWSSCSQKCDKGLSTRTRTIKTRPEHGGKPCKNLKETKECTLRSCKAPDKVFEGNWGSWSSKWSLCPEGSYVAGLRLRTQKNQGWWIDDTAANAIEFACKKPNSTRTVVLQSNGMGWGEWSSWSYCSGSTNPSGSFKVRNQERGGSDDTAVNDVSLTCFDGSVVNVTANTSWGKWFTRECKKGYAIVGIKTRVDEGGLGAYDNTALNGIRVKCEFISTVPSMKPPKTPSSPLHQHNHPHHLHHHHHFFPQVWGSSPLLTPLYTPYLVKSFTPPFTHLFMPQRLLCGTSFGPLWMMCTTCGCHKWGTISPVIVG